jgi:hypothetical protein
VGPDLGASSSPPFSFFGSGTLGNPYQVWSSGDLAHVGDAQYRSSVFKLMSDLDLTGDTHLVQPIGYSGSASSGYSYSDFTGVFDGSDYTISGWTYDGSRSAAGVALPLGFFASLGSGAVVKNLTLGQITLSWSGGSSGIQSGAGILAGLATGASILNVTVNRPILSLPTWSDVGGIVGSMTNSSLRNSYSSLPIAILGQSRVGGLVGHLIGSSTYVQAGKGIAGSRVRGSVIGTQQNVGGMVGLLEGSTVTGGELVSPVNVSGFQNVGGIAGRVTGTSYLQGVIVTTGSVTLEPNAEQILGDYAGKLVGMNSGVLVINACPADFGLSAPDPDLNPGSHFGALMGGSIGGALAALGVDVVQSGNPDLPIPSGGISEGGQGRVPTLSYAGASGTSTFVNLAVSIAPTTFSFDGTCAFSENYTGFSIDRYSCVITGASATSGPRTLNVVATNSAGSSSVSTVTLSVDPCNVLGNPFGRGAGTADSPYEICSVAQLALVGQHLNQSFILKKDLDLSGGMEPIGYSDTNWLISGIYAAFTGVFDGNHHTLSGWNHSGAIVNYDSGYSFLPLGLFAKLGTGASVKDLKITGFSVFNGSTGDADIDAARTKAYAGILAGLADGATISNVSIETSTLNLEAWSQVGGIVGLLKNSVLEDSHFGSVTTPTTADVLGVVLGLNQVGGLVGVLDTSTIRRSYFSAQVQLSSSAGREASEVGWLGGLVGKVNHESTISGNVISDSFVSWIARIDASQTGGEQIGGLVGGVADGAAVFMYTSYAAGRVFLGESTPILVGGLIGFVGTGSAVDGGNSFWDTESTWQSGSAAGVGKTTFQMQQAATFSSYDSTYWYIVPGSYPVLN